MIAIIVVAEIIHLNATDIGLCGSPEFDRTVANKCNNTFNVINFEMTISTGLAASHSYMKSMRSLKKKHTLVTCRSERSLRFPAFCLRR